MIRAYEELVDFIATGPSASSVSEFEASPATKARAAQLIQKGKAQRLSPEEASELEHFMQLEHLMRLAKARARVHLTI